MLTALLTTGGGTGTSHFRKKANKGGRFQSKKKYCTFVPLFTKDFCKQYNYSFWSQILESQVEERAQRKGFNLYLLALDISVYRLIIPLSSMV